MSDMKCPFCNQKLEPIGTSGQFQCGTWGCDASFNFIATRDVWEYVDRTRKALDVALDALDTIKPKKDVSQGGFWTLSQSDILDVILRAEKEIKRITKGGSNE